MSPRLSDIIHSLYTATAKCLFLPISNQSVGYGFVDELLIRNEDIKTEALKLVFSLLFISQLTENELFLISSVDPKTQKVKETMEVA